jgi:nucleoside-diphosphate-sugar epimerase
VPGIYALDRLPLERLKAGTPSIHSNGDSYTNHVHADDLARLVLYALNRGRRGRVYHACDSKWIKAGDYFDLVADSLNLARPKRISMAEAEQIIPANAMSFLRESRRLSNDRLLRELKVTLRYPSVEVALANIRPPH